jgi:hypothetical protein
MVRFSRRQLIGGVLVVSTLFGLYPFLQKLFADGGFQGTVPNPMYFLSLVTTPIFDILVIINYMPGELCRNFYKIRLNISERSHDRAGDTEALGLRRFAPVPGPSQVLVPGPHQCLFAALRYSRIKLWVKRRTHSLFRQGCMLYELIPTMPEVRLLPLIERFTTMLAELPVFADTFGTI